VTDETKTPKHELGTAFLARGHGAGLAAVAQARRRLSARAITYR
jgi:hypothetical protein